MSKKSRITVVMTIMVIIAMVAGCAVISPKPYDLATVTDLEHLEEQTITLFQSFTSDTFDTARAEYIKDGLSDVYSRESNAGDKATAKQIKLVQESFDDYYANRIEGGPWSEIKTEKAVEAIAEIFDTAIATEKTRNTGGK